MTGSTNPRARQSISKDPAILEYLTGVSEHRRKRLKLLVERSENGSSGSFGETVGRGGARIRQFLSPTYNNGRSIGERVARTLEHEAGLPFGWLDQHETSAVAGAAAVDHDQHELTARREAADAAARAGFMKSSTAIPNDNPDHRALFALPPIRLSEGTALVMPALPVQKVVTGDGEVDAVLWLREVISTGQADLIAKAKEAADRIKTPLKDLEKRYRDWLQRTHPDNWVVALSSFGFADLDGLASTATTKAARQHEARARFGDGNAVFDDTPAEKFCVETLRRVRKDKGGWDLDAAQVDKRFDARPDHRPATLTDCIAELTYWRELYWLRHAVGNCGDTSNQVTAREDYVFRMLSRIPRRNAEEAAEVFRYITSNDWMGREHIGAIMLNLIGAPEPYKAKQGDA